MSPMPKYSSGVEQTGPSLFSPEERAAAHHEEEEESEARSRSQQAPDQTGI